jgi:hypothetical protein
MAPVPRRLTDADRLRQLEEQYRMDKVRACLAPSPRGLARAQHALAQEHRFARSRWARVPATVGALAVGSLTFAASELGGLALQAAVVAASALVVCPRGDHVRQAS